MPGYVIPVEELAGASVDLAVCGRDDGEGGGGDAVGTFVENGDLRRRGRRILEEEKGK